jgi:hypothetical protein
VIAGKFKEGISKYHKQLNHIKSNSTVLIDPSLSKLLKLSSKPSTKVYQEQGTSDSYTPARSIISSEPIILAISKSHEVKQETNKSSLQEDISEVSFEILELIVVVSERE